MGWQRGGEGDGGGSCEGEGARRSEGSTWEGDGCGTKGRRGAAQPHRRRLGCGQRVRGDAGDAGKGVEVPSRDA